MKTAIIVAAVILSLVGGAALFSSSSDDSAQHVAGTSTDSRTFADIQKALRQGALLLDVRTADEYAAGHIDGATNLSLQDMQSGKQPSVGTQQTIYVYCHSGNRSRQAAALLKDAGFSKVVDLGSIAHVQSIGGTVVSGS